MNDSNIRASAVHVGDYVQWISLGAAQFCEPQQVTHVTDDGVWAFVDLSDTGILVSELVVEGAPEVNQLSKNVRLNYSVVRALPV